MAAQDGAGMIRRAAKRDDNEPSIVQALEAVGATVTRLSVEGVPDLLVGFRGRTYLLEVKLPLTARGAVQPGRRRNHTGGRDDMTAAQVAWLSTWRGERPVIVRTAEEALMAIGAVAFDEQMIAKIMATTGIDRAGAERAARDGKRLADALINAYEALAAERPIRAGAPEAIGLTPSQLRARTAKDVAAEDALRDPKVMARNAAALAKRCSKAGGR